MKLTKLSISNFKKIQQVDLELSDLNILVGVNGSGKSSILQAVHLACCAIRQAKRFDATGSTIAVDQLDYLPTEEYKSLGHRADWGNKAASPSSKVEFYFNDPPGNSRADCSLRSARNSGISVSGNLGLGLGEIFRGTGRFFSAYIPGISGIPNREEKRSAKVILRACSYGDSNVVLRNVLLLLSSYDADNLRKIEAWIGQIVEPIKIEVSHNESRDLTIDCRVTVGGDTRPLELLGTGYLQLIQIFSYILLFSPGILLIDEPDIHLHPNVQERLIRTLSRVAGDEGLRILLATHSPFIVRGAPPGTNVYWLNAGRLETGERASVELALGWGAFGKKCLIFTEDTDCQYLKAIVASWPEIDRAVAVIPGRGYRANPNPNDVKQLAEALGNKYKIVVHRDRDALTEEECRRLVAEYAASGATLWITESTDVEAYFCQEWFLATFFPGGVAEAQSQVNTLTSRISSTRKSQFTKQRGDINKELYAGGGSPKTDDLWQARENSPTKWIKGKMLLNEIFNIKGSRMKGDRRFLAEPTVSQLAPDLKTLLETVMG